MMIKVIVSNAVKRLYAKYGIVISETDLYICPKRKVHIRTSQVAVLFRVSYHQFTNKYVRPLLDSGVTRVIIGGVKYYNFDHIEKRLQRMLTGNKDIFAVCAEMTNNKSKRK